MGAELMTEVSIAWLATPSRTLAGSMWPTIARIYAALTDGLDLPVEPPATRRYVDVLLQTTKGPQVLEFDEIQHFNAFRATTIDLYPPDVEVAFPLAEWHSRSINRRRLEGGSFGSGRPMFRMVYGRHRERAFRDALTDLLPNEHGLQPTIRIASWEVQPWIWGSDAGRRLAELMSERTRSRWRAVGQVDAVAPPIRSVAGHRRCDLAAINAALEALARRQPGGETDAVTAGAELKRLGLLTDSPTRPGKPLRDLLRAGLIEGSYQDSSRRWHIVHGAMRSPSG